MSKFVVTKAERQNVKARIGLTGATNTGKTWSALLIAKGLLESEKVYVKGTTEIDWSKICIIDTERNRSLFYANNGVFGKFSHINFEPPYDPESYVEAVKVAEENGAKVIIIDSLSHAWNGTGGVLEIVNDRTESSRSKNQFTAGWGGKEGGTALQNKMIDSILSSKAHIIATFRQKMEYVQERNETTGRTEINKIGIKPVQRDDLEYEFDVTLKFNNDHTAEIIKNTLSFIDEDELKIKPLDESFGKQLGDYLATGEDPEKIKEESRKALINNIKEEAKQNPSLFTYFNTAHSDWKINELTTKQCYIVLEEFKEILNGTN